ncbi:Stp1/IreP family PP2C-type Ser/Thr phosphatase [Thermomonospora umbrina]|uniref:Serine/threonine protein phosphatase PstP n=1 Tax=Thermomonospora umbrina TaxID=111806 RepID=A0A3D9SSB8_9ACTN|nr:Stp1/IreP family PP2C-type Ser/Thr phosphatase [Thermomonospora umbrina]REE97360.1 protein phosphatase [Thermomonospora umbrina]
MSIGIRYAARSDVGMLREGNEDSAYAGAHLLAVADGMGGHVGGEIASAAAIGELRKLDTDLPANDLLAALEHTVKAANEKLHRIVESDPALQGMGTTLTAMLWSGSQVALVHIGDSRAYLLRDGSLFQITHDHTLVQSLVDEGRISPDEAASHPQRSLLLRALDGRGEVDPDLSLREAKVGDRYLLCSDGLSGVVTAETIFQVLSEYHDPEQAVRQLIDLANRGGGPDNITCVVADVIELAPGAGRVPPGAAPLAVGAAANVRPDGSEGPGGGPQPAAERSADTPAGRAAQLRDTLPQQPVIVDELPPPPPQAAAPRHEPLLEHQPAPAGPPPEPPLQAPPRAPRRWTFLIVAVAVFLVALMVVAVFAIRSMRGDGFYAVAENGVVVVYTGSPDSMLGLRMNQRADEQPRPPIQVRDLPKSVQAQLRKKPFVVLNGADGWRNLAKRICKYSLLPDGDKVAIVQGVDQTQDGCEPTPVAASTLKPSELPASDRESLADQKFTFPDRAAAQAKLRELERRRDACKSGNPGDIKDCPARGNDGGKRP